ncbi:hypothetical protein KP509_21G053200 [Ceratopteris richardii]|uniref:Uncharacterized protein n=1 Tax=Ceratopteris richardii TaxID=49495 RepID=A0A8T2SBV2_CERRI|nr:hypothetical protein KP509_21G053200 [Ceratopteris richardii]
MECFEREIYRLKANVGACVMERALRFLSVKFADLMLTLVPHSESWSLCSILRWSIEQWRHDVLKREYNEHDQDDDESSLSDDQGCYGDDKREYLEDDSWFYDDDHHCSTDDFWSYDEFNDEEGSWPYNEDDYQDYDEFNEWSCDEGDF